LLEGYFVRTLGMHRVYNSAFMNMLRDEENAKYRSYLKKTIEFDPDIMKRYVNFMSNPDERTAIDQFGDGDKYFGVCTLLATLPGLPMFGHGQIEGFTERYGMEFKTAKMDERPKEWLVERHQREIAPLLKNRRIFAGSTEFTLYDFWTGYGTVNENVFAYSNRTDGERSLVVYNNKYDGTQGTIHISAAAMDKGSGELRQKSLADGLALPYDDAVIFAYRDATHGLEYLRRATDIHQHGLSFDLGGFQCAVLLDWRERRSSAEYPWDRLCDALQGGGVPNLDEALAMLRLRPLHDALREAVSSVNVHALAGIANELAGEGEPEPVAASLGNKSSIAKKTAKAKPVKSKRAAAATVADPTHPDLQLRALAETCQRFFERVLDSFPDESRRSMGPAASAVPEPASGVALKQTVAPEPSYAEAVEAMLAAATHLPLLAQSFSSDWPAKSRPVLPGKKASTRLERTWAPVLAWIVLRSFPWQGDRTEPFDRLLLRSALAEIFASMGMDGEAKWQAAAQVRVLLSRPSAEPDAIRTEVFFRDPDVRWLAGVNQVSGITYFNKEQFEELLTWLQLPALIEIAQKHSSQAAGIAEIEASVAAAREAAQAAGYNLEKYLAASTIETERLFTNQPELASNP